MVCSDPCEPYELCRELELESVLEEDDAGDPSFSGVTLLVSATLFVSVVSECGAGAGFNDESVLPFDVAEGIGVTELLELGMELLVRVELDESTPLCREAAVPDAVPDWSGVDDISPVSLRAQPAKQMRVAVINASFFIILCSFNFMAASPLASSLLLGKGKGRLLTRKPSGKMGDIQPGDISLPRLRQCAS